MADAKTKVVPLEPTWEMQIAGRDAMLADDDSCDISTDDARVAYQAMVAAAPQPAASDVPHDVVRVLIFRLECLDEETQEEEAQECAREAIKVLRALATPAPSTSTEEALRAENARLKQVLEPFARVAEHDIGTDEADDDLFRPFHSLNRAPRLTVGHLREALSALSR